MLLMEAGLSSISDIAFLIYLYSYLFHERITSVMMFRFCDAALRYVNKNRCRCASKAVDYVAASINSADGNKISLSDDMIFHLECNTLKHLITPVDNCAFDKLTSGERLSR